MEIRDHLKLREFQQRCGLSLVTLRRYVKSGRLPSVQPGGPGHSILIPLDALDRLCARPRTPSIPAPAEVERKARKATLPGPKPRWRTAPPSPTDNPADGN